MVEFPFFFSVGVQDDSIVNGDFFFHAKLRTGKNLANVFIVLVTAMMSVMSLLQGLATHAGLYSNQIPIKVCPCSASVYVLL